MKSKYRLEAIWFSNAELHLEVDHDIFTDEKAKLINEFWTGSENRLRLTQGSHKEATIRLFGEQFINWCFTEGGACAGPSTSGSILDSFLGDSEGWGGDPEWLGFKVTMVDVTLPEFDDIELEVL